MSTSVIAACGYSPAKAPTWHTNDGRAMPLPEMETSHLFYSLRMVWNATMPAEWKQGIREPKPWTVRKEMFPYYRMILPQILAELKKRSDLDPICTKELGLMQMRYLQPMPTTSDLDTNKAPPMPLFFKTVPPASLESLPLYHPKQVSFRYHERTKMLERLYALMCGYQTPTLPMGAGMAAEFKLIMDSLKELES
jgi:hypothetical protein